MTLRTRIAAVASLSVALAVLAAAIGLYVGVSSELHGQIDSALRARAQTLSAHVERHGGDLARLVPALAERMPGLPAPRQSDPETERYLMYAAATGLLEDAGVQEPLLLIIDDLQIGRAHV